MSASAKATSLPDFASITRPWRRLGRLGAAAPAALALCLILLALAGARISREATEADDRVAHTLEVLVEANGALSAVQDAETGQRGSLLTRDPDYLQPYEAGRVAALHRLQRARQLTAGNPGQQARLATLEAAVTGKLAELSTTVELARGGNTEAALAVVRTGEGQQIMLRIRRLILDLHEEEERLLTARKAQAAEVEQRLSWLLSLAAGVALATAIACAGTALAGMRLLRRVERQDAERGAAEALAESEARLRDLLVTLDLGNTVVRGDDGRVLFWSKGCERLYGWTAEEAVGRETGELLRSKYPTPLPAILAALRCDGHWRGDLHHTARDGRELVVAAEMVQRTVEGKPPVTLISLTDVAAQRRAEADLAASEARLRLAGESAGLATWDADLATGTASWTANQFAMLDYVPDRSGWASNAMWHDRILPEDWPAVEAANRDARPGMHAYRVSYRIRRADDGAERWIETVGRYLDHGPDGAPRRAIGVNLDITDRRAAEAALAESEAFGRSILCGTSDCMVVLDAEGRVAFMNEPGRCQKELDDTAQVLGRPVEELWPEESRRLVREAMTRARDGHTARYTAYGPTAKGTPKWWDVTISRLHARDGEPPRLLSVARDVTERRRWEQEVARFKAFSERSVDAHHMFDAEGRVVYANRTSWARLGYTEAEFLTFSVADFDPDWPVERFRGIVAQAMRESVAPFEARHRRRDGTSLPVEVSVTAINEAGGPFLLAIVRDISERKAAEAALRESEARFRSMADHAPSMVWETDAAGFCTYLSQPWCEFTGQTEAEGFGFGWLEMIHPEDRDCVRDAFLDAAARRGGYRIECRLRRASDAGWAWVIDAAAPRIATDGSYLGYVGSALDITDIVAARQVLTREAEQLDRLAEERGRALAESERRLAQAAKMEALGRLAGGIAHDFNNVLQAVHGGIAIASKRLPPEAEPVRKYLRLASDAAGRGAAVTGRLLAFARRGELQAEPVAPGPLLSGLVEFLQPVIGPNLALRTEVAPGLPPLLADKGQLEAVLVNLVNNARDAMAGGGGLTLGAEAATVPDAARTPHGLAPGVYVRLYVVDEGEGIPPEVLTRMSEPFFTTKPRGQGTGLGLAMARGFAEQSGGGLLIESAPGRGTSVSVWLPRVPDRSGGGLLVDDRKNIPRASAPPAGELTVLLAEDQSEVRAVLAAQLRDHGYAVWESADAAAALLLVESGVRFDALVTDLAMPGEMDGLDLLGAMRARLPRLPAVLVTGHAGDALPGRLERAEQGGPFALLRKPAAAEMLFDRLARVLRQAGLPGLKAAR
ncbi:PAS domain S-box protein [Dankookia rubra]|uniref:histidine kinase n=1 Tax=Dankookia rubra TaxID=1442381 RepID=A0A4R5QJ90_9PROT|nr:PAS domain S-box protein [Dankookia rubra]TDH62687.1 PAS domain S-box protein [Dankookia rubra]